MASQSRNRLFLGLADGCCPDEAGWPKRDAGIGADGGDGCVGPFAGSGGCTLSTLVRPAHYGGFAARVQDRPATHIGGLQVTTSSQATLSNTTATPSAIHVPPRHP